MPHKPIPSRYRIPSLTIHSQFDKEHVKRGHNFVVDGWAGAYIPNPHPLPPPSNNHTDNHNCNYMNARFRTFDSSVTDGGMDEQMDGRTDGQTKPLYLKELRVRY